MPQSRSPEEFFEVFREIQESKKKRDEKPGSPGTPAAAPEERAGAAAEGAAPGRGGWESLAAWAGEGSVTVSYVAVGGALVVALLLIVAAYLLGRQQGWYSHAAAVARKAAAPLEGRPGTAAPAAVAGEEPEYVEGKVFTLLIGGKDPTHRRSVEEEASYLNAYAPFRALQVQAYVWRDKVGRYRLCARGLAALSPASREQVKTQVRALKSRFGKREYEDADLFAP